jgi:CheY-like chemotaxis protein
MGSVRLIHWNLDEAKVRAKKLREAGYQVDYEVLNPDGIREMKMNPPTALIIDLGRLPMQGRDLGLAIRHFKGTRHVPIIFVDGDPEKVKRVKENLPDAVYSSWSTIRSDLKKAISHPLEDPVVPKSVMAGYSGTPLVKKLGIKTNSVLALVNAPKDFEKTLGRLPESVTIHSDARGHPDLIIWFTLSCTDLERDVAKFGSLLGKRGIWIAWPKKTSGVVTDLSEKIVRQLGLASELVDYKICSIDATWSGLLFTKRKKE